MNGDPLAALRDWHVPPPVSWWPPAPGWWLLGFLVLLSLTLLLRWWLRRRRRLAAAGVALQRLDLLCSELATGGDARLFAAGVSRLLRRLALVRFPREQVAGLAGSDWLAFLDRTGGNGAFSDGAGRVLADAPFRDVRESGTDTAELARLAADWIRSNRFAAR